MTLGTETSAPIARLDQLRRSAIAAYRPTAARLVRVRGWFGPNWLGFKGKAIGAVGYHSYPDSPEAIVPPFVPSRVIAEIDLAMGAASEHDRPATKPFHGHRTSENNLRQRISGASPDGTLVAWLSEVDDAAEHASLMVYLVRPDTTPLRWYVEAVAERGAVVLRRAGISAAELEWLESDLRGVRMMATIGA